MSKKEQEGDSKPSAEEESKDTEEKLKEEKTKELARQLEVFTTNKKTLKKFCDGYFRVLIKIFRKEIEPGKAMVEKKASSPKKKSSTQAARDAEIE